MTHPTRHIVATAPEVVSPLPDGWTLWTPGYTKPPTNLAEWLTYLQFPPHSETDYYASWLPTGRVRASVIKTKEKIHILFFHEMRPPHTVQVHDWWYDPQDLGTKVYVPGEPVGYWVDTAHRLMRAVAGTPVPDGWTVVDDPEPLAVWAPLALDQWRAQDLADMARQTPQTTVVVSDRPDERDRWEAWRGVGGYAQSVGRYPTRDEARDAVIAQIEAWRAEHAWLARVAPWPTIEVIDARSPGWLEVDGTRQALTAEVEALAADGLLILDEPVDDAVTRLIERRYRPGRLRAELIAA